MRLSLFEVLKWLTMLLLCTSSSATCPSFCVCNQDERGKRKVTCLSGGMTDIPTTEMDPNTEVIHIEAPQDNPNTLTISPMFQHFKKLEEVQIRRSGVLQIGMHSFWGVPTIRLLDLVANKIAAISDHNFRGLVNLIELNLDRNRLSNLPSGVFKHLTELRILSLKFNLINELVPRLFLKLGKLHVLKLSGNPFDDLDPEAFKDVPELRILECRNCLLRRINTQIYHLLPYLSHLDLGNNQIQFIAADEFQDLRKLHTLKMDGNQLPVILEKTFVHQTQLKHLNVAKNRLAKITNTAFLNLSNLQELDISHNKLDKLEATAMFHVSNTLMKFNFGGNNFPLAVIKAFVEIMHKLADLDISQLKLTHLPSGLIPNHVKKLNISHNNLTNLSVEALPTQLNAIDLSFNKFKGLNEKLVLKLERLKFRRLDSNPWTCDLCNLGGIMLRINKSDLFANLTCAYPEILKGTLLTNLRPFELSSCVELRNDRENFDDVAEKEKLNLTLWLVTLLTFLLVCIVFVVCSCMRRRTLNAREEEKRQRERDNANLAGPVAVFSKGEISFKFPLDLTERKVSVCTIDEIKRDSERRITVPNGNAKI